MKSVSFGGPSAPAGVEVLPLTPSSTSNLHWGGGHSSVVIGTCDFQLRTTTKTTILTAQVIDSPKFTPIILGESARLKLGWDHYTIGWRGVMSLDNGCEIYTRPLPTSYHTILLTPAPQVGSTPSEPQVITLSPVFPPPSHTPTGSQAPKMIPRRKSLTGIPQGTSSAMASASAACHAAQTAPSGVSWYSLPWETLLSTQPPTLVQVSTENMDAEIKTHNAALPPHIFHTPHPDFQWSIHRGKGIKKHPLTWKTTWVWHARYGPTGTRACKPSHTARIAKYYSLPTQEYSVCSECSNIVNTAIHLSQERPVSSPAQMEEEDSGAHVPHDSPLPCPLSTATPSRPSSSTSTPSSTPLVPPSFSPPSSTSTTLPPLAPPSAPHPLPSSKLSTTLPPLPPASLPSSPQSPSPTSTITLPPIVPPSSSSPTPLPSSLPPSTTSSSPLNPALLHPVHIGDGVYSLSEQLVMGLHVYNSHLRGADLAQRLQTWNVDTATTTRARSIHERCSHCTLSQYPPRRSKVSLPSTITSPWTELQLDLIKLPNHPVLPGAHSLNPVETIIDCVTGECYGALLPNCTAQSVVDCLYANYIFLHGHPAIISCDLGSENASLAKALQDDPMVDCFFFPYLHVIPRKSPHKVGVVERLHRTLRSLWAKLYWPQNTPYSSTLENKVRALIFHYNTKARREVDGSHTSPFLLHHGFQPTLFFMDPQVLEEVGWIPPPSYFDRMEKRFPALYARLHTRSVWQSYLSDRSQRRWTPYKDGKVGEHVLVFHRHAATPTSADRWTIATVDSINTNPQGSVTGYFCFIPGNDRKMLYGTDVTKPLRPFVDPAPIIGPCGTRIDASLDPNIAPLVHQCRLAAAHFQSDHPVPPPQVPLEEEEEEAPLPTDAAVLLIITPPISWLEHTNKPLSSRIRHFQAAEAEVLKAIDKEWANYAPKVVWIAEEDLPPEVRLFKFIWILCEKMDERGLRVKARFCIDGSPENPGISSLFLTHTSMIEGSMSEVQLMEAQSHDKLTAIIDVDGAFNRTANYADLAKLKKGFNARFIYAYPPSCSGAPPGCVMQIPWPAYGMGDGPSGYNITIDYRLTHAGSWSRSLHPNLFYQGEAEVSQARRRMRLPPPTTSLPSPAATLGNFMDDSILTSIPERYQQLVHDIENHIAPIGRIVPMEVGMPLEYLGSMYTLHHDQYIAVDLQHKITKLPIRSTPTTYESIRGSLQHLATRGLYYLLPNVLDLYLITPTILQDHQHQQWRPSLQLMDDILGWLHKATPPPKCLPLLSPWSSVILVTYCDASLAPRPVGARVHCLVAIPPTDLPHVTDLAHHKRPAPQIRWYPGAVIAVGAAGFRQKLGKSSLVPEALNSAHALGKHQMLHTMLRSAMLLSSPHSILMNDHLGNIQAATQESTKVTPSAQAATQQLIDWHEGPYHHIIQIPSKYNLADPLTKPTTMDTSGNCLKHAMEKGVIPLPYYPRPLNPPHPTVYDSDRGTLVYHPTPTTQS